MYDQVQAGGMPLTLSSTASMQDGCPAPHLIFYCIQGAVHDEVQPELTVGAVGGGSAGSRGWVGAGSSRLSCRREALEEGRVIEGAHDC